MRIKYPSTKERLLDIVLAVKEFSIRKGSLESRVFGAEDLADKSLVFDYILAKQIAIGGVERKDENIIELREKLK